MISQIDIEKQQIEFHRWFADDGDSTHRLLYDLNENSVVFDLGGYEGSWAKNIHDRYKCHLYIFEPIPQFEEQIRQKFQNVQSVKVINSAASNITSTCTISFRADASSMFGDGQSIDIHAIDIADFIRSQNISIIDLMKINIEGAEYDVMEHLIKNNLHTIVNNFQIQYHLNIESYSSRLNWITSELLKTHTRTYSYQYVWEGWKLK